MSIYLPNLVYRLICHINNAMHKVSQVPLLGHKTIQCPYIVGMPCQTVTKILRKDMVTIALWIMNLWIVIEYSFGIDPPSSCGAHGILRVKSQKSTLSVVWGCTQSIFQSQTIPIL